MGIFQKPQNENIRLTNLNVENDGNFPIFASGVCMERNVMMNLTFVEKECQTDKYEIFHINLQFSLCF